MRMIDIHAHIQQHDPEELEGILQRASEAGVGAIVASGVTVADSERCVDLANLHDMVLAGTGVHPTDLTGPLSESDLARLDRLAADESVVVMSEVGIDHQAHVLARERSDNLSWIDIQEEAFRQQIKIARDRSLPIIFHIREPGDDPTARSAWPAALKIFRDTSAGELGGAAHYFQGDDEAAKHTLDAGFMVSFGRPLLRTKRLQEIAKWLPKDRIVIETDSYPQPFKKNRMKWTEPRHLLSVAECLSELRGTSTGEVIELTTQNALSLMRDPNGRAARLVKAG